MAETFVIKCDSPRTQIKSYIASISAINTLSITGSEKSATLQYKSLPCDIRQSFHYDSQYDMFDTSHDLEGPEPDPLTCFRNFIIPYSRVAYHYDVNPYDLVIIENIDDIMPLINDQHSLNDVIRGLAIRQIINRAKTLIITTPEITLGLHELLKESKREITRITDLTELINFTDHK